MHGAPLIVPFLARPAVRLLLTSAAVLFAEVLLIRWIPSQIIYVGFFNNFILFRDSRAADMAFTSNVVGAMVGGVLEWTALVTGYQSLIVVAAALYLVAYLLATRWRFFADRVART